MQELHEDCVDCAKRQGKDPTRCPKPVMASR
jgi:hypothetical protein